MKNANINTMSHKRATITGFSSCHGQMYHNEGSQKDQNQDNAEASTSATLKALPIRISVPML